MDAPVWEAPVGPGTPAGIPVSSSMPASTVDTAPDVEAPARTLSTTSAESIRLRTFASGTIDALAPGELAQRARPEEALDLLVDPADRLNLAVLVDRAR